MTADSYRWRRLGHLSALVLLLSVATLVGYAQTTQAPSPPGLASIPSGPATNQVVRLTLREAIDMAIRYNLGAIESDENSRIARGQRLQALSSLLPQFSVGTFENVAQITAASFGIRNALIPQVLGPFAYSTAQASVSQSLLNFESIQRFRAARTAEQAANLSHDDTLDVVTLIVGTAYLQVIQANSRIEAEQAQVRNAEALYKQAVDELRAGTTPRIDVTRTSVQLHTEQYNLSIAQNNFAIAKLNLSRAIGLPLGQPFENADQLPYADLNPPTVEEALKTAYASRSDFRAALDSVKSAQHQLSAARAQRYPVLLTNSSYGVQGPTFGHSHGIFSVEVGLDIPIFTGGRIEGEITQADAALRQRQAEADNLRGQIDYDVRTAFLNLQAGKEEVAVATENVDLANENLSRSRERFAAGVTDSVEVVQAQQSLASANDQYITSLYSHNLAKLELARALGVARSSYSQYLAGH